MPPFPATRSCRLNTTLDKSLFTKPAQLTMHPLKEPQQPDWTCTNCRTAEQKQAAAGLRLLPHSLDY